jgi:hypothetical protein
MRSLIAKEHTVPTLNETACSTPWKLKSRGGKEENFMTVFPEIF